MTDVPYFKPPETGPLWPDEAEAIADDASTFLMALDRDVSDAIARQNRLDTARESFRGWVESKIADGEIEISLPKDESERAIILDEIVDNFFPLNPEG